MFKNHKFFATTFLVAGFIAFICLPGCGEPTIENPWKPGERLTEAQLVSEAERVAERINDEAQNEIEAEQARIEDSKRDFEAAVAALDLNVQLQVIDLQRVHDRAVSDASAAVSRITRRLADAAKSVEATLAKGRADIERQWERREAFTSIGAMILNNPGVSAAVSTVPLGALAVSIVGNLAQAFGRRSDRKRIDNAQETLLAAEAEKRKAADDAWDEATKVAELNAKHRDDHYDLGSGNAQLSAVLTALVNKPA